MSERDEQGNPSIAQTSVLEPGPTIAPIEPDRPDVTNGTHIVDVGLLQVEFGAQHVRVGTLRSVGTPLTLRIGLFEWLEGRISTDGFLHQTDQGYGFPGRIRMVAASSPLMPDSFKRSQPEWRSMVAWPWA